MKSLMPSKWLSLRLAGVIFLAVLVLILPLVVLVLEIELILQIRLTRGLCLSRYRIGQPQRRNWINTHVSFWWRWKRRKLLLVHGGTSARDVRIGCRVLSQLLFALGFAFFVRVITSFSNCFGSVANSPCSSFASSFKRVLIFRPKRHCESRYAVPSREPDTVKYVPLTMCGDASFILSLLSIGSKTGAFQFAFSKNRSFAVCHYKRASSPFFKINCRRL